MEINKHKRPPSPRTGNANKDLCKSSEFKIQALVKDGLEVKKRIDSLGIFKNKKPEMKTSQKSPLRQATSQELTYEETAGQSQQTKKLSLGDAKDTQSVAAYDGNEQNDHSLLQNNATYNKLFTMTNLLDQLQQKSITSSKRQDAVGKLKQMIQSLIIENQQIKVKTEMNIHNNISSSNEGSAQRLTHSAGHIIDNFQGDIKTDDLSLEQFSTLQAQIWTLQSENDLLNQKLIQMIEEKEKQEYQLKTVNNHLLMMLQEVKQGGKSAMSKFYSTQRYPQQHSLTPKGLKVQQLKSPSYKSESQQETILLKNLNIGVIPKRPETPPGGIYQRSRGKCQSQSQFQNAGSLGNLLIGGLESIESDKEGEDLQLTLRKKSTQKHINDDLFESMGEKQRLSYSDDKEMKKTISKVQQNISDICDDNIIEEGEGLSSDGCNQSNLIDEIKENMETLRKINTTSSYQGRLLGGGGKFGCHSKKSAFSREFNRQPTKSFIETESDATRQPSHQRSASNAQLPVETIPTEPSQNTIGYLTTHHGSSSQPPLLTQIQSQRRMSGTPSHNHLMQNLQYVRSQSRDHKFEPKSTWEPNEQGGECALCKNRFNFIKRKHHCRKCGLLVCAPCSGNSCYVPGYADKKVRMCDQCYKEWMAYKVSSHNINKTSVFSSYFGNNAALTVRR